MCEHFFVVVVELIHLFVLSLCINMCQRGTIPLRVKTHIKTGAHWAWTQLSSYTTERELQVQDARIGIVHKVCLGVAASYLLFTILTSHSYLKTEAPVVTINAWIEGEEAFEEKLEQYRTGQEPPPWYCKKNAETEYVYSYPSFVYFNNTCDMEATTGDITLEESTATEFVTYYQDTPRDKKSVYPPVNAFVPSKWRIKNPTEVSISTPVS